MSFVNCYQTDRPAESQPSLDELLGPSPYDINFPFPVLLDTLQNDRVRLVPFIPRIHAQIFLDKLTPDHDALLHPFTWKLRTLEELLTAVELRMRRSTQRLLFAVLDKTQAPAGVAADAAPQETLAGIVALEATDTSNLSTELASVVVLRKFQRTHVTTNMIGLLLRYCLNRPSDAVAPGLGLRRVEWRAGPDNAASLRAARRTGFRDEGVLRWMWVVPAHMAGRDARPGGLQGMDCVTLSICWDDWENGTKEHLEALMSRK